MVRGVMVFNATFNNISAISWWTCLLVEDTGVPEELVEDTGVPEELVEDTGVPEETHRPAASHWNCIT